MSDRIAVSISLSGGCEILFGTRKLSLDLEAGATLGGLVERLRGHVVERPDQFITAGELRPGILALVNDTDAELLGGAEYVLEDRDDVSFISTLHGG